MRSLISECFSTELETMEAGQHYRLNLKRARPAAAIEEKGADLMVCPFFLVGRKEAVVWVMRQCLSGSICRANT